MATEATVAGVTARKKKPRKALNPFAAGLPIALIALAVSIIGFWRTFLSRLAEVDLPHHVHGWTSFAWLGLVLSQALLIRSGQYRLHRILGWASIFFFAVMMISSWQMIALMLSPKSLLPFEMAKFFAYTDLIDIPLILVLYGGAIVLRKDRHVHSRLITATVLATIIPALGRMFNLFTPGMDGLMLAMHPTYLFVLTILGVAIYIDSRNGRLRWPLPFAFAWFVMAYATLWTGAKSAWFDALARSIAATA